MSTSRLPVHFPFRVPHGAFALAVALLCLPSVVCANDWDGGKKDCLQAFDAPAAADEKVLMQCADRFNAGAQLDKLSKAERATIEKGLRYLYDSSDKGWRLAREGLYRLEIKVPARSAQPAAAVAPKTGAPAAEAPRTRYDPPPTRDADKKEAADLADGGVKLLKKQKWAQGADQLEKAVAKDPRSEFALYNLVCAEANLPDRKQSALKHLQNLADLGTDASSERLIRARGDADLVPLREDPDFKRITGYIRIQIVNTIGRPGEPAIENIEKVLEGLGHKSRDLGVLDKPQEFPIVLFKPHAKAQTALIAELLNHPKTRLDPITFDTKYDLIIRWGAKVTTVDGKQKADSIGPDSVDDSIAAARNKQNKILAQPEAAINDVNKIVSTPERAYGQVEAMGKRVDGTVKKAQGAVDKMKDLGDKLNSL